MATKNAIKVPYELPVHAHHPNDGVSFWNFIRFEIVPRGACFRSGIRFKGVVAQRRRAESCSTMWHHEADDRLVEVENSDWLEEVYGDTGESRHKYWKDKHHYMIYIGDGGPLEVIADSWELMPEEKGEWPKIRLE